ncbi:MAG: polysaccharide pyruvyl transferase family protein [Candidatus Omnitrophota bacterium]
MVKIVFIGASGYRNIGDNAYKELFTDNLPQAYQCYFESPYPDLDILKNADLMVIGGGGLIYDNESEHFNYMKMYIDEAIRLNIPYGFSSAGIQWRTDNPLEELKRWTEYLKGAKFICLRSPKGKEIISELTGRNDVKYYPDLCYLLKPSDYYINSEFDILFIPHEVATREDNDFTRAFKKAIADGKKVMIAQFSRDEEKAVDYFREIATPHNNLVCRKDLTPREALGLVSQAKEVHTFRYHGLVFANSLNVPVKTYFRTTKILSEIKPHPLEKSNAVYHADKIMEALNGKN